MMFYIQSKSHRILLSFLLTLFVAGCGGSEGSSSKEGGDAGLSIAQDSVSIYEYEGSQAYPTADISVRISNKVRDEIAKGKNAYFVIEQTRNIIIDISAEIVNSNNGTITLEALQPILYFPLGEYKSTLTIYGCFDANCNQVFGEDSLELTYHIVKQPSVPDRDVELADRHQIEAHSIEIDYKGLDISSDSISFLTSYEGDESDWLHMDYAIDGDKLNVNFATSVASCGIHSARVKVTQDSSVGLDKAYYFDVNYEAGGDGEFYNLFPKVHHVGKPIQASLIGCGLQNQTVASLNEKFSNLDVTAIRHLSPYRIELVANPIMESGSLEVVQNSKVESAPIEILIKEQITNEAASTDFLVLGDSGFNGTSGIYDAFRDILYWQVNGSWHAIKHNSGKWEPLAIDIDASVDRVLVSNDGNYLFLIQDATNDSLTMVNANNYDFIKEIDLPGHVGQQVYQDSNGKLVSVNHYQDYLVSTDIETEETTWNTLEANYSSALLSRDKTVFVIAHSGGLPLSTYNLLTQEHKTYEGMTDTSAGKKVNLTGERTLLLASADGSAQNRVLNVFDSEFNSALSLPTITEDGKTIETIEFNKAGDLAYALYCTGNGRQYSCLIREYEVGDLLQSPEAVSYRAVGSFDIETINMPTSRIKMILSADENTLFVSSKNMYIFQL
ncbi:hypothetical protein FE810_12230 [Thalassotalea litorea]|uniref:Uncharacterized protein n=1 Tax=Thalassotalea litorea TaxID=2020715 RepID=A0A5R9IFQ3_9GAMM|nr:hypothetical protein [Thalassotalea litorea]TLU64360.1 hypothetical protein FE810_12230 [Thalassotalea litorea]